jgi:DNA modification methylase
VSSRLLAGHAPAVLAGLEPESCHMVVTSPPYWNLRSYGTEPQIWPNPDGTPLCAEGAHEWSPSVPNAQTGGVSEKQSTNRGNTGAGFLSRSATCSRCGAMRCELGQEPTVERYIAHLVFVFDAVRRVLRRDGLAWINLAGSYFNNPGGQNGGGYRNGEGGSTLNRSAKRAALHRISAKAIEANRQAGRQDRIGAAGKDSWLKPLDFVDTPGLFAHAMQRAGWYWRADICLVKRAPLPESVQGWRFERCRVRLSDGDQSPGTAQRKVSAVRAGEHGNRDVGSFESTAARAEWADCPGCSRCAPNDGLILRRGNGRPTRAWERFLVFAKAPGAYFDSEAVREPQQEASLRRYETGFTRAKVNGAPSGPGHVKADGYPSVYGNPAGRNLRDWQFWPDSEMVRLRSDLTPEQRASVLRSIADAELLSSGSSDESSSEYPDPQT